MEWRDGTEMDSSFESLDDRLTYNTAAPSVSHCTSYRVCITTPRAVLTRCTAPSFAHWLISRCQPLPSLDPSACQHSSAALLSFPSQEAVSALPLQHVRLVRQMTQQRHQRRRSGRTVHSGHYGAATGRGNGRRERGERKGARQVGGGGRRGDGAGQ